MAVFRARHGRSLWAAWSPVLAGYYPNICGRGMVLPTGSIFITSYERLPVCTSELAGRRDDIPPNLTLLGCLPQSGLFPAISPKQPRFDPQASRGRTNRATIYSVELSKYRIFRFLKTPMKLPIAVSFVRK